MKKIIQEWSTEVEMTTEEAKVICKLGEGKLCCAFLVGLVGGITGFQCVRLSAPLNSHIFKRLEEGTMAAQGRGGWKGCAWEGEI